MTVPVGPPNYQQLVRTQVGVETIRGTSVTKTNKWYGRLALTRRQPLADSEDFDGSFFGDVEPVRGAMMVDGTYYQPMAYEDVHLLRYAVKGGVTPVTDGETTPGYLSTFRHTGSRDDLDTASIEYGTPEMIWACNGIMFPEFTFSSDIDDPQAVWKFNARAIGLSKDLKAGLDDVAATSGTTTTFVKTAWGLTGSAHVGAWIHVKSGTAGNIGLWREVTANDTTSLTFAALPSAVASGDVIDVYPVFTAAVADRAREKIIGPGTKLYLDPLGGTIGTTEITGRFISWSVTSQINAAYKRFQDNVATMSNRVDRGTIRMTGQVVLEFDRKAEWDLYKAMTPSLIRIEQTGTTIDAGAGTTKSATIDLYRAVFDDPTETIRGNNVIATWPFRAYKSVAESVYGEYALKTTAAALLA